MELCLSSMAISLYLKWSFLDFAFLIRCDVTQASGAVVYPEELVITGFKGCFFSERFNMLHIKLFGELQLNLKTQPYRPRYGNNILAILVYLALEGHVDRRHLAALVWGHRSPVVARSNLRGNLHSLKQSLLQPFLSLDTEQVGLQCTTDIQAFQKAVEEEKWLQAETLYQGPLLENFEIPDAPEYMEWLSGWRNQLHHQHRKVLLCRIKQLLAEHQPEQALQVSRTLHLQEPLNEDLAVQYVKLLLDTHKAGEARSFWSTFCAHHHQEFGVLPLHTFDQFASQKEDSVIQLDLPAFSVFRDFPFCGRDDVLQSLNAWFAQQPRSLMLVLGEPGMGKTRMLQEWSLPYKTLVIRGSELERETPYYALYGLLRQALVEGKLEGLMSSWQLELHSLLTDLVPRPTGAGGVTSLRLMEALSQALQVCLEGLQVLVLEDAHWFDAATARVFQHLFRKPWETAVVFTARPMEWQQNTLLHLWQMDMETQGQLQKLQLLPLQELPVYRLVHQISGSSRVMALARKLYQITGGSPYFTVEYLKSIMQRHHLQVHRPEGWEQADVLESLQKGLPDSVREVLLSRLQQESEGVRRALELASALGQHFSVSELWASGLQDRWEFAEHLDTAQQRQWIAPGKVADYQFSHDLVREVIYHQLSPARSCLIHQHMAQGLEQLQADAGRIAHHFHQAGLKTRAYPYWRQAAQRARELWAHQAGLEYLARALECTSDPREGVEIRIARGRHLQALELLDAWEQELNQCWELTTRSLGPDELIAVSIEKMHLYLRRKKPEKVIELSQQLLDDLLLVQQEKAIQFYGEVSTAFMKMGNHEAALKWITNCIDKYGRLQNMVMADLYLNLAYVHFYNSNMDDGVLNAHTALDIFTGNENYQGISVCYNALACLYSITDSIDLQKSYLEEAYVAACKGNIVNLRLDLAIDLTRINMYISNYEQATIFYSDASEIADRYNLREYEAVLSSLCLEVKNGIAG